MIVMIDNYDSFTYNLVQYLKQLGAEMKVFRNDAVSVTDLESMYLSGALAGALAGALSGIVISPGPGRPESAGISLPVIKHFSGKIPILGVCLGHQAIAQAFGADIVSAKRLMHGKTSTIKTDEKSLYRGIAGSFQAMRYHSLAVSRDNFPDCFEICSESEDGEIMGIRHRKDPTEGIQFHPESIMTPVGKRILRNFLKMTESQIEVPKV